MGVVWRYVLEPGEFAATPLCTGRQVLFGVDPQHGSPLNQVMSAAVRSVSRDSGALNWEYRGVAELGARVRHTPIVDGDLVFVATHTDLVALDLNRGTLRWRMPARRGCRPLSRGDVLYVSRETELLALDQSTGKIRNRRRCGSSVDALAVHPDGDLLLSMFNSRVLRLDPATLQTRQTYPIAGKWAIGAPVVVVDELDLLVVNSWAGFVLGIEAGTGVVRWRKKKAPGRLGWTIPVGSGMVLCTTPDLVMLAADTGALRWKVPGPVQHAVVDDTHIYALTVGEDCGYELAVVARDTGTVTARMSYGRCTYPRESMSWKENGFAVDAGIVVTTHVPGEVAALDLSTSRSA